MLPKVLGARRRTLAGLILWFREGVFSQDDFDDFEHHQLWFLVMFQSWFLKTCEVEGFHCFDWALLALEDLGEKFLEARKQALLGWNMNQFSGSEKLLL